MTRRSAQADGDTKGVPSHDRSLPARVWYNIVRFFTLCVMTTTGGIRASGRNNMPSNGPVLLISNHLSFLDVFVLGIPLRRPLNYVARSTLFVSVLGFLMRSVGAFPINREGMGASGLKETLRRLRNGGIVILFPEGTRSLDGRLGELKAGIAVLALKARAPIVPAGIAGTFEAWPRARRLPSPHALRIEYGPPIYPEEIAGLTTEAITALLHTRMLECQRLAVLGLARDLQIEPPDTY